MQIARITSEHGRSGILTAKIGGLIRENAGTSVLSISVDQPEVSL